ncbi:MAG TPA: hypothetical protein VF768_01820 [Holophagaceae bacterium]
MTQITTPPNQQESKPPVEWTFGSSRSPMFDSLSQKLSQAMKALRG